MKVKKLISLALAGVLTLSTAIPVSAAVVVDGVSVVGRAWWPTVAEDIAAAQTQVKSIPVKDGGTAIFDLTVTEHDGVDGSIFVVEGHGAKTDTGGAYSYYCDLLSTGDVFGSAGTTFNKGLSALRYDLFPLGEYTVVVKRSGTTISTDFQDEYGTAIISESLVLSDEAATDDFSFYIFAQYGTITVNGYDSMDPAVYLTETTKTLMPGKTAKISSVVGPRNTTGSKTITWASSDEKIATVDSTGTVTAVADGTCNITATVGSGAAASTATCAVTVTSTANPITAITAAADPTTLEIGGTTTVTYKYTAQNTTLDTTDDTSTVTYTSSNPAVATVDNTGKITAVAAGSTKVTVTIGTIVSNEVEITVNEAKTSDAETSDSDVTKATKVTAAAAGYTGSTITLVKGKTATISATVTPAKASQKVTYKSSNKKVATVSSKGVVKGVKAGTAKITVTAADGSGKKATVTVKVVKKAVANKALKLKKSAVTLKKKGATATIAIKSQTKGTTDTITYTLDKAGKKLVSVDKFGVVTVKKAPTKKAQKAVVTVKCGKKSAKYTITLKK